MSGRQIKKKEKEININIIRPFISIFKTSREKNFKSAVFQIVNWLEKLILGMVSIIVVVVE